MRRRSEWQRHAVVVQRAMQHHLYAMLKVMHNAFD
jgi:hypothetical protein